MTILVLLLVVLIVALSTLSFGMSRDLDIQEEKLALANQLLDAKREDYSKLLSQKKSSEVRTGQIAEQMAPFLDGFPYSPKSASFLGRPIDFIVFDDTGVHLVEVKSGKSQLSSTQRKIRDLVNEGRVTFEVYRVKGE